MYNLIFDMGGVLMSHNVPGCIVELIRLMGEDQMRSVLGLCPNGEGLEHSLMEDFECGRVSEADFIEKLRRACPAGTTAQQIVDIWNIMHAGIAPWKLEQIRLWHEAGHHILLLSNSNSIHRQDILTHYDMSSFDQCFYSHLLGAQKPDPKFYDAVMRYLQQQGWDTLPTVFVDDLQANRAMGEQYGWRTYESIEQMQTALGI